MPPENSRLKRLKSTKSVLLLLSGQSDLGEINDLGVGDSVVGV